MEKGSLGTSYQFEGSRDEFRVFCGFLFVRLLLLTQLVFRRLDLSSSVLTLFNIQNRGDSRGQAWNKVATSEVNRMGLI